ncbi:MAG: sensor domain-containing diguanylate cyclase [Planctomycetaceae bacterium]|nr:sensor domain-containing diguanylate cyclase [Planctomycetaceae bacterium]
MNAGTVMDFNENSDLFEGVPAFDDAGSRMTQEGGSMPLYTREEIESLPQERLVDHILQLQTGYCRLDDDVKFLNWEFKDYQNSLTYFSRAAKLAHKLNAATLDTIASVAIQEIPGYFCCDFAAFYLYEADEGRFRLYRSTHPEWEAELEASRDSFLPRLFTDHVYPYAVVTDQDGAVVETDTSAVLADGMPDAWRRALGNKAIVFPLGVKNDDNPVHAPLGGIIIGNSTGSLEAKDVEVSLIFGDLLSSSLYNAQLVKKLNDLTIIDPLTSIYNRRHLVDQLTTAIVQARRQGHPLSIIMADIDYFKRFNDNYGHIFGDSVLRTVASLLRSGIRDGVDVPARYGGEEFIIVLPFIGLDECMVVAERIRKLVKSHPVSCEGEELTVTCSFGVAQYLDGETMERFIDRADEALYLAKNTGRDRVAAT